MKKIFIGIFWLWSCSVVAQESLNCNLLYNWDSDTVPGSYAYNNSFNEVWGMVVNGREFAVIGSTIGTHIFEVTNPEDAHPVAYIPGAFSNPQVVHRDYHDYQGYLYAACDEGESTLQIIDISNLPESVEVVYDSDQLFSRAHNLFIDEDNAILYAAGGSQELSLFSLEDPTSPTLLLDCQMDVSNWDYIGYVHDLYVRDNIAYCNAADGLYIVDFNDLNNPEFLGSLTSYSDQGYNHSGWLNEEGTIYALADETTGTRIKILDVSNPSDINVLSLIGTEDWQNSIVHNVIFVGDKLHVSYYSDGYYLFDIANPESPQLEAYYYTCSEGNGCDVVDDGAWGVYPLLPSGHVLISDQQNGLFVLEAPSETSANIQESPLGNEWEATYSSVTNRIEIKGLDESTKFTINIHNALGQLIQTKDEFGAKNVGIQAPTLSNGIYFVTLHSQNIEKTFKIIK